MFLGLSDKDPSSVHCDSVLVKVKLPNTRFNQVQLDVLNRQMLQVQSPDYVLKHFLPYPVDKDKGRAQFDSDKGLLSVTVSSNCLTSKAPCDKEDSVRRVGLSDSITSYLNYKFKFILPS